MKNFRLSADEIRNVAVGYGSCFASDKITVDGELVGFMYREDPDHDTDSGWRFTAGNETAEYMDEPNNHGIYDVNTIANYDAAIIPLLDAPVGSAFERDDDGELVEIEDWEAEAE